MERELKLNKPVFSEDWLALVIGLSIVVLSLGVFAGRDVLGWVVATSVWTNVAHALRPTSKAYVQLPGGVSLLLTYLFLLAVMALSGIVLRARMQKFLKAFTAVFFASYFCWVIGSWAHIAATPDKMKALGITRSLNLTPEAGFIVALLAGLLVGNLLPPAASAMREAIRPELYVKTAIVLLGGSLGITAAEQLGLSTTLMLRGVCAIIEAYLIYWAVVYYIARKYFKFSPEWAVPLASGISICGVSAAIATGSAIKARPAVPILVSSLVVIFAVVELMFLPFVAKQFLYKEPMVAGAWMGLAVKTDGAAVASGAITESLLYAKAESEGIHYQRGWIVGATTTVKVFIDVFIGIWAFLLAWIWSVKIEGGSGQEVRLRQIWDRFPKFILGYVATFALALLIGVLAPSLLGKAKAAMGEASVFRGLFFVMTFFAIGVLSDFRKLWTQGVAKLAAIYLLCLFGFVIWVGLAISWIFFHGIKPPLVHG